MSTGEMRYQPCWCGRVGGRWSMMSKKQGPDKQKARKILKHGKVRGKPLTRKQRAYMGARSS